MWNSRDAARSFLPYGFVRAIRRRNQGVVGSYRTWEEGLQATGPYKPEMAMSVPGEKLPRSAGVKLPTLGDSGAADPMRGRLSINQSARTVPAVLRQGRSEVLRLKGVFMIHQLREQGLTVSEIARRMRLDRKTVRRYLQHGVEQPRYGPRAPRPQKLDPYRAFLLIRGSPL